MGCFESAYMFAVVISSGQEKASETIGSSSNFLKTLRYSTISTSNLGLYKEFTGTRQQKLKERKRNSNIF